MGHITVLGPSANEALERALRLKNALATTSSCPVAV
jgi:hypothetical protein